jgi:hypothetical protein
VSGDVVVYESRAVGTKLVGLVEVANWGRLAAAVLLRAVGVDDGTGPTRRGEPPRERGTVRTARAGARENRGELSPEPAVITPSGRTTGRGGDRRVLITDRGRYTQTSHTYRTLTTPRISPRGDRWAIGPTASVLEPLG